MIYYIYGREGCRNNIKEVFVIMSDREKCYITNIAKSIKNGKVPTHHEPNIIVGKSIKDLLEAGIIYRHILSA